MPKLFDVLSERSKERFSKRKLEVAGEKGVEVAWEEGIVAVRELQGIVGGEAVGGFILAGGGRLQSLYHVSSRHEVAQ